MAGDHVGNFLNDVDALLERNNIGHCFGGDAQSLELGKGVGKHGIEGFGQ